MRNQKSLMEELGINTEEIRRRMNFIGFAEKDVRLLQEMESLVREHADRIVAAFYRHLISFEETWAFLKDQATVDRLITAQKEYLLAIFRANFDEAYFEGRLRIGAVHHRIGLAPKWYIGAYCLYANLLSPLIAEAYRSEPDGGLARILAVRRILQLDMSLALDFYFHRITAELGKKIQDMDDFIHMVAHDLKEPLRGIEALSDILLEDYAHRLNEQGRRYLNFMRESAIHMKDLIHALLSLATLSQKTSTIQPTDLNQVLTHVQRDLEFSIKQKGTEIQIRSPLPTVYCDPIQIGEVFKNLLSNAIKFNRATPPQVEIAARDEGSFYLFSVKDNGIGIDPRHFEQIFRPFERIHSKEEYEGTGMGLALCKKIIEGFGGKIWAESRPGEGSAFFFTLPK